MDTPQFPSNSKSTPPPSEPRKAERVVTNEVKSRPRSLGTRLKQALFGGDSKTALQYVIGEVIVPQAKDLLSEATTQMIEQIIFGGNRTPHRRSPNRPGYTNYRGYSARPGRPTGSSIRVEHPNATARTQDLDEIIFATRAEAQAVLEKMYEFLEEYELVSVADLYTMLGWTSRSTHTDQKWGWEDLRGSDIRLTRGGYILILPKIKALS